MRYMGSKKRIVKHIVPIMLGARKPGQYWVEPFVGSGSVIEHVANPRIGNDLNPYVIALLRAVRDGWLPPTEVSREMYHTIKNSPHGYDPALVGFVAFACSFGGKMWGGYAKDRSTRNYALNGHNSLIKQAKNLVGAEFFSDDYQDMRIPPNSLIYCDPPYTTTTKYKYNISHTEFWNWCRDRASSGHTVFVSESSAPNDFECVYNSEIGVELARTNKSNKRIEKLFRI